VKLAALCCTYLRPRLLGELIESFHRQDYPAHLRELVILDDAGQYRPQHGDGWHLHSTRTRFPTLGEKRNACAALASPDAEGFLVADDDDVYLPHWFATQAEALRHAEWSIPSKVWLVDGETLVEHPTAGQFHGGWAFRRATFERLGGYRPMSFGEDTDLAERIHAEGIPSCDPRSFAPPFYIYRYDSGSYHLSFEGDAGYLARTPRPGPPVDLTIGWSTDWTRLAAEAAARTV
jgi:glycosyltransferase involved in cell wall biosynthesis